MSKIEDTLTQFMQMSILNQKNTNASIKILKFKLDNLQNNYLTMEVDLFQKTHG